MIQKIQAMSKWDLLSAVRTLALVVCLMMLGACASNPPTLALQAAEQAIDTAEKARVSSPELNEAREKLAVARSAVLRKQMILAEHYADESRVVAELAFVKAETAKAKSVNDEMIKSTNTLKQEMQRSPGDQQ